MICGWYVTYVVRSFTDIIILIKGNFWGTVLCMCDSTEKQAVFTERLLLQQSADDRDNHLKISIILWSSTTLFCLSARLDFDVSSEENDAFVLQVINWMWSHVSMKAEPCSEGDGVLLTSDDRLSLNCRFSARFKCNRSKNSFARWAITRFNLQM